MAGSLAMVPSERTVTENPLTTTRDPWEIQFSRFFVYPTISSKCPDLAPPKVRRRHPSGTWISSSSPAVLRLASDLSNSDVILTVCFRDKIIEEHYVSKLHFSWPQVSCVSGFPARGIRVMFVSYKDLVGEIQKFALRFSTIYETETFINALKEILKDVSDIEPLNSDFGSEISSQSELVSSNRHSYRACEELSDTTPLQTYTPQMPPSLNNEVEERSSNQEMETMRSNNFEGVVAALPPSFTSLMTNCGSEFNQGAFQSDDSDEVDLKSQIAKYMEDSSFQDMLIRVDKVICELGGDLTK